MMGKFWLDTTWGCGYVETDSKGKVIYCAPIFRRFIGQHLDQVVKAGGYKVEELEYGSKNNHDN